jgi:hypothetical protein
VATYLAAARIIGGLPSAINVDGGLAGASGNTEVLDYSGWMRAICCMRGQRPKILTLPDPSGGHERSPSGYLVIKNSSADD